MPVAFDTSGMEQYDERTWFDPRTGDQVSLTYIGMVPDLPAGLDEVPLLRYRLALETAEIGALIEAHVVTMDTVPTLLQLLKVPIPGQEAGQAFIAAFTVPKATCSAVLRIQCTEDDSSAGVREAAVFGQVGVDVRPHPYAPEVTGLLPWHTADDGQWDGRFPDHPLSRARAWAHRMIATARIDPEFARLPPFRPAGGVMESFPRLVPVPGNGRPAPSPAPSAPSPSAPSQVPAPSHVPSPTSLPSSAGSSSSGSSSASSSEAGLPVRPSPRPRPVGEPRLRAVPPLESETDLPVVWQAPPDDPEPAGRHQAADGPAMARLSAVDPAVGPEPVGGRDLTGGSRTDGEGGPGFGVADPRVASAVPAAAEVDGPAVAGGEFDPELATADLAGVAVGLSQVDAAPGVTPSTRDVARGGVADLTPEPSSAAAAVPAPDAEGAPHSTSGEAGSQPPFTATPDPVDSLLTAEPASPAPFTATPDPVDSTLAAEPAPPATSDATFAEPVSRDTDADLSRRSTSVWGAFESESSTFPGHVDTPMSADSEGPAPTDDDAVGDATFGRTRVGRHSTPEPADSAPEADMAGDTSNATRDAFHDSTSRTPDAARSRLDIPPHGAISPPNTAPEATHPTPAPAHTALDIPPYSATNPPNTAPDTPHPTPDPAHPLPDIPPHSATSPPNTAPEATHSAPDPAHPLPDIPPHSATNPPNTAPDAAHPALDAALHGATSPPPSPAPDATHPARDVMAEPAINPEAPQRPTNPSPDAAHSALDAAPHSATNPPLNTAPEPAHPTPDTPDRPSSPPPDETHSAPTTTPDPAPVPTHTTHAPAPARTGPTVDVSAWTTPATAAVDAGVATLVPKHRDPAKATAHDLPVAAPTAVAAPVSAGDVMHSVVVGLPVGGYVALWLSNEVTYWRMTEPDLVRDHLGVGLGSRSEVDVLRFREAAMLSVDKHTLFLADRFRDRDGHLGGTTTQLVPATEDEALAAVDDRATSELYRWLGEIVLAAGERDEFVAVESGGWQVSRRPRVQIMLRPDGDEWHSVVETSPVPVGAPVWRDQQPVDGNSQSLVSPATDQTLRAAGLLTRFAVATWGSHPLRLCLSFGPNPTLGEIPTR